MSKNLPVLEGFKHKRYGWALRQIFELWYSGEYMHNSWKDKAILAIVTVVGLLVAGIVIIHLATGWPKKQPPQNLNSTVSN